MINIFTPDADAQRERAGALSAASIASTRASAIVADLEAPGLIEKIEPHKLKVPRGDRSGAVHRALSHRPVVREDRAAGRARARSAVEDGRIRFVPENWSKTYFEWMRNIQDWCISRQLWWGHRIPAWYDDATATIYVGRDEAEVRTQARAWHATIAAAPGRGRARHLVLARRCGRSRTLGWPDDDAGADARSIRPACWSRASTSSSSGSPA